MSLAQETFLHLSAQIDCKLIWEDQDTWNELVSQVKTAQVQYKAFHLKYQESYFKEINESYGDTSIVIYRGGQAVGVWPLCVWQEGGTLYIGSAGISPKGSILPPLLPGLQKAESQRKVFQLCISSLSAYYRSHGGRELYFCETVMDAGVSRWHQILMERGGKCVKVTHHLYTDMSLSMSEIQAKMRRTNKYSIAQGEKDYLIDLYDENFENIAEIVEEFRHLHITISGRETRSKETWEMQKLCIEHGSDQIGHSFVIFIRDKHTRVLAGAALFDATPSCAYYCVAAYDRSRFSKPVGHIVQAAAMMKLKEYGVRWYELGERPYITDDAVTQKLLDIGHYKEGFATNCFLKLYTSLEINGEM